MSTPFMVRSRMIREYRAIQWTGENLEAVKRRKG